MMHDRIQNMRAVLERRKGNAQQLQEAIAAKRKKIAQAKRSNYHHEQALEIVKLVTQNLQDTLRVHLSDICSMAMASVFPNPYDIQVDFVSRRGKIESDIHFVRDGHLISPLQATGGGAVDIAALSFRFSCWTLGNPKTRPIMFLDEPLKWLKGRTLPIKGANMIKHISEKLNIQVIMVSHDTELIQSADKIIDVDMKDGISVCTG